MNKYRKRNTSIVFDVLKNMTFTEYLKSYWYLLNSILRYHNAYKNYLTVIMHIVRNKYPIESILRDGEKITLKNYYEVYLTSFGTMNYCSIDNNIITITKNELPSQIKLHLGQNNGDIQGVFFDEAYRFLPVKGKTVIDIGANIGDSSIYFAIKGANKILALEPFPKNYETAKSNIELNNLSNKVELLLAGCSDKKGEITVDPTKEWAGGSLDKSKIGIKVPLMTLEDILETHNIDSALLKVDCEGCEYDTILFASDKTLEKFTHIQIEYHYGYKNLKEKLEKNGFKVSVTNPCFIINHQARRSMYFGYLYATRNY